jgi:hypothetical protein
VTSTLAYHAIELNIRVQKFYKTGPGFALQTCALSGASG